MKRILCIILMVVMMAGMFATVSAEVPADGVIVGMGDLVAGETYTGYIYKIEERTIAVDEVFVYFFLDDGTRGFYRCAENTEINGVTYSGLSQIVGALEVNTYAEFQINSDNRFCSIEYYSTVPEDRKINARRRSSTYNGDGFTSEITLNYALEAATAYQAVYDWDGKLIEFSTENVAIGQETLEITTDVAPGYNGITAKIMFWDRGGQLKPLGNSLDVSIEPVVKSEWYIRGVVTENSTTNINYSKVINKAAGKTIVLDVTEVYGTENEDFQFDASGKYIGIDKFLVGDTDAEEYLGHAVGVGVDKTDDGYKIVTIGEDGQRDETLKIRLDQYAGHTTATDNATGEFEYYKDGEYNATKISIPAGENFSVVLNGNGLGKVDLDEYLEYATIFDGEINLINNDDFAGYDVAIINLASVGVVDEVFDTGVIFKNDCVLWDYDIINELEIDETDNRSYVKITKNGTEIPASELQENDVLAVYTFADYSSYMYAEVITNTVSGTIVSTKRTDSSATSTAYKIGDAWYEASEGMYGAGNLEIGSKCLLYLGNGGKIFAAFPDTSDDGEGGGSEGDDSGNGDDTVITGERFAYITDMTVSVADDGLTPELTFQLLTSEGVTACAVKASAKVGYKSGILESLDLYSWVIDGDTVTQDYNGQWAALQGLKNQVVKCVFNDSGVITSITEAGYNDSFVAEDSFVDYRNEWDLDRLSFAKGGAVAQDAQVFVVDSDLSNCYIGTVAELEDGNVYEVIAAYSDSMSYGEASVIVLSYNSFNCVSMISNLAVVVEAGYSSNSDGEEVWTINYWQDGDEITCDTNTDVAAMGGMPQQGDILKIKVNSAGIITDIREVWTDVIRYPNSTSTALRGYYPDTAKESFVGGVVDNWVSDYKEATIDGEIYSLSRAENVYVIDATGKKIIVKKSLPGNFKNFSNLYGITTVNLTFLDGTTISNITPATARGYADHIYIREYDGKIKDVVIVKGFIDRVTVGY